jgi:hypothetical protein
LNRRGFFKFLGLGAAATVVPEILAPIKAELSKAADPPITLSFAHASEHRMVVEMWGDKVIGVNILSGGSGYGETP